MELIKLAGICLSVFFINLHVHAKSFHQEPKGRIIGGNEVKPHSVPYMVALLDVKDNSLHCGGTLISQKYVLTAAHCLYERSEVIVALGVHNWTIEEPTQVRLRVNKDKFTIHPNHTSFIDYSFDIAVIELPEIVELNENIQLVQLPNSSFAFKSDDYNEDGDVYGWGVTDGYRSNKVLRNGKVNVRIITSQNSYLSPVVYYDSGICDGDYGSPLIIDGLQIGVSSLAMGDAYCERGINIHISVPRNLKWINETTDVNIK